MPDYEDAKKDAKTREFAKKVAKASQADTAAPERAPDLADERSQAAWSEYEKPYDQKEQAKAAQMMEDEKIRSGIDRPFAWGRGVGTDAGNAAAPHVSEGFKEQARHAMDRYANWVDPKNLRGNAPEPNEYELRLVKAMDNADKKPVEQPAPVPPPYHVQNSVDSAARAVGNKVVDTSIGVAKRGMQAIESIPEKANKANDAVWDTVVGGVNKAGEAMHNALPKKAVEYNTRFWDKVTGNKKK